MNEAGTALATPPLLYIYVFAPTHDYQKPHPLISKVTAQVKKMLAPCQNTPGIVCSPRIECRMDGGPKKFWPQNAWKFTCHKKYIIMWETIVWLRRTSVLLTGQLSTFVKVFPIFCLVLLPRLLGTAIQLSLWQLTQRLMEANVRGVALPIDGVKLCRRYWQAWNGSLT